MGLLDIIMLCAICNQLVFLIDIRQQINNDKYHV